MGMSAKTSDQPREPAGVPTGGQWTETQRAASGLALVEDQAPVDGFDEGPEPTTYDLLAANVDEARKRIERANRRLERAGIEERFEATYEPYSEIETDRETGLQVRKDYVRLTLNRPQISYEGYTFAARIDTTESGRLVAMAAPGQELDGWEPESLTCEHCGTQRQRKSVYAVRGPDGRFAVVGSSCMQAYLGVKPEGLWTLEWDDLDDLDGRSEPEGFTGGGTPVAQSNHVLATAAAVAKLQGGYQSSYADRPTAGEVRTFLYYSGVRTEEERRWREAIAEEVENVDVAELRSEILEAIEGNDSDWARNIRLLMDEEYISDRHAGVLASAVSAVERMRAEKRQRVEVAKGFVAPVGEKVTDTKARILKLREFTSHFGHRERTSQLVRMQTASGHIVTWFSSKVTDFDEGDEVVIDRATVKEHEVYNGEDQTVVTRAKLSIVPGA